MSLKCWTLPAAVLLTVVSCSDVDEGPLSPTSGGRSDDVSALQPIIANGCNAYEGACDDEEETETGGGGGSDYSVPGGDMSGAAGSTGDSDGDGSAEVDEGLAIDDEWDCDSHDDYENSSGDCNLRQPTAAERDRFNQLADELDFSHLA